MSHYNKYTSFKFAQLIIFFTRRVLLSPEPVAANHSINSHNQQRRNNDLNQRTVIARSSRSERRGNPPMPCTWLDNRVIPSVTRDLSSRCKCTNSTYSSVCNSYNDVCDTPIILPFAFCSPYKSNSGIVTTKNQLNIPN